MDQQHDLSLIALCNTKERSEKINFRPSVRPSAYGLKKKELFFFEFIFIHDKSQGGVLA